uniref:Uncharacterized protein n=1 Tax=Steinernema glaseri TaxID=37863 RepID=A0A1I7ZF83_9BILA
MHTASLGTPRPSRSPSQRVSRSGLVYGSSLLSDGGADMDRDVPADLWYDMERFQMVGFFISLLRGSVTITRAWDNFG